MKQIAPFIAVLILIAGSPVFSQQFGFEPSIGAPRGYMDFSINSQFFTRFDILPWTDIEFRSQNYFAFKGDNNNGMLFTDVFSIYGLVRIEPTNLFNNMRIHLSPGVGLHFMYSWAKDNPFEEKDRFTTSAKANILYGVEHEWPNQPFYVFFQGRLTYPSEIMFDTFNAGLGFRLM